MGKNATLLGVEPRTSRYHHRSNRIEVLRFIHLAIGSVFCCEFQVDYIQHLANQSSCNSIEVATLLLCLYFSPSPFQQYLADMLQKEL